jgi:hypothetical protein
MNKRNLQNLRPWPKAVSGNPGGVPRGVYEVRRLARLHTREAVATLVDVVNHAKRHPAARVLAARASCWIADGARPCSRSRLRAMG